jgi:hypothetical protein
MPMFYKWSLPFRFSEKSTYLAYRSCMLQWPTHLIILYLIVLIKSYEACKSSHKFLLVSYVCTPLLGSNILLQHWNDHLSTIMRPVANQISVYDIAGVLMLCVVKANTSTHNRDTFEWVAVMFGVSGSNFGSKSTLTELIGDISQALHRSTKQNSLIRKFSFRFQAGTPFRLSLCLVFLSHFS